MTESRQILLICDRRTGSNLLGEYIKCSPGVIGAREIFNCDHYPDLTECSSVVNQVAKNLEGLSEHGAVVLGKIQHVHLRARNSDLRSALAALPFADCVVLARNDLVAQYASLIAAQETGVWIELTSEPEREPRVARELDEKDFERFCRQMRRDFEGTIETVLQTGRTPIVVEFEEFATDPQPLFDAVLWPRLSLEPAPLDTVLRRQSQGADSPPTNEDVLTAIADWVWPERPIHTSLSAVEAREA